MRKFNVGDTVRCSDYVLREKKDNFLTADINSRLRLSAERAYQKCLALRGIVQKIIPGGIEVLDSEGILYKSADYMWEKD